MSASVTIARDLQRAQARRRRRRAARDFWSRATRVGQIAAPWLGVALIWGAALLLPPVLLSYLAIAGLAAGVGWIGGALWTHRQDAKVIRQLDARLRQLTEGTDHDEY